VFAKDGRTFRVLEGQCRLTVHSGAALLLDREVEVVAGRTVVVSP
jgi:mannose-6-phosphate isomerase-like protein (cupin superfamily)